MAGPLPAVKPVMACAALAASSLESEIGAPVQIDRAEEKLIEGALNCQITGTIAPKIRFEIRLPVEGWTQRYLQTGCGGLCGSLDIRVEHADRCQPVKDKAIAVASTDMGHQSRMMGDGSFGVDPQARIDFAYRGVHLTASLAKSLIRQYYGQAPRYSYFSGCSDGGREALMEVERYPADFDGVAAGAPAMNFQVQNSFYHAWMYLSNHRPDGSAILTARELPALHAAALASCDAADGLRDGQITDPRACSFDPALAQCKPGQNAGDCLSAEQVEVARKFYQGPVDQEGHHFTIGGPQVGSELAWQGVFVPDSPKGRVMSEDAALGTLRYLSFPSNPPPDFDLHQFHFDRATFQRLFDLHPLYDATDPDIEAFRAHGGKLILWHGWSDPHISPINTIAYWQAVTKFFGPSKADGFMKLFLFPGMYHCHGGDGPGEFDVLTPLMDWVENGAAPAKLIAGNAETLPPMGAGMPPMGAGMPPMGADMPPKGAGMPPLLLAKTAQVTRTRPVFPYPAIARYTGSGSVDDAANFTDSPAIIADPGSYAWEGSSFYSPGLHRDCSVSAGILSCH